MNEFSFTIHGTKYDVRLTELEGDKAKIMVNGTEYQVLLHRDRPQPKTPRLVRAKAGPAAEDVPVKTYHPAEPKGVGMIKAPLPGTVLKLMVKPGDKVARGDTVLVLEAMKMENEIRTDRAGMVKSVLVAAGTAVLEGEALVEIGE